MKILTCKLKSDIEYICKTIGNNVCHEIIKNIYKENIIIWKKIVVSFFNFRKQKALEANSFVWATWNRKITFGPGTLLCYNINILFYLQCRSSFQLGRGEWKVCISISDLCFPKTNMISQSSAVLLDFIANNVFVSLIYDIG